MLSKSQSYCLFVINFDFNFRTYHRKYVEFEFPRAIFPCKKLKTKMMKNSARFVRLSRHTRHSPIQETESEDFDQY